MKKNLKEYKTPDEIMKILRDRGMTFNNPKRAKRILTENNYFFIKGYNQLLLDGNNNYKNNIDFEDLFDLYILDKDIKMIVFRHLLEIEQKIKANLSNFISSKYGIKETKYLKKTNFDSTNPHVNEVIKNIKKQKKIYGEKNEAVKYYKNKYNYVPLWVLSKSLTMGTIRDLYSIMKPDDQDRISREILYIDIDKKRVVKLKNIIALLSDVRNMCAHDEILMCYKHKRIHISKLPEHSHFSLKKNKTGDLVQGVSDLFAILLSIKYLINRTTYNLFIQNIESKIEKFLKIHSNISREELLKYINLPDNFSDLKKL